MVRFFLATLPAGALAYYFSPRDLWFIPTRWLEPNELVDFGFWLLLYVAAFFGGILQIYNLADRGFSLRIAIDIDQSPAGVMTADDLLNSYSQGKGIVWMYQKRIDDLIRLKLIEITGEIVEATPRGRSVAARFAWLRRFLQVTA
jgi:hypothetical protein